MRRCKTTPVAAAAALGFEAASLIPLRLARMALGGPAFAAREATRMVTEKAEAAAKAAATLATGGSPATVVSQYRKAVRANRTRLSKG